MKEHSYNLDDRPADENLWDQKAWSELCRITATGIHDDGGNWIYSILVACLAQCSKNLPQEWRIATFAGKSRHVTGDAEALSARSILYIGDIEFHVHIVNICPNWNCFGRNM